MIIGNHVWVGEYARMTKNAKIYDNSIVGASTVACKDYSVENGGAIIVGNPGIIVKTGVNWS